jgi:hypothetical protein
VEKLDEFCLGCGLVGIMGSMGGEHGCGFGGDGVTVGWDNPETCSRVAFAY